MKRILVLLCVLCVLTAPAFSGVVKKTRSEITFKGFGRFSTSQSEKVVPQKHWVDSQNDFKGKGLLGGLAGKTVLRSGNFGEITDLPALSVYRLDPKKREYTVSPIKNLSEEMKGEEKGAEKPAEEKAAESDVKIIKSEFKVEETGESQTINAFQATKYVITWVVEWENIRTGEKGTNSLESVVWATPYTDVIVKAQEEEHKYFRAYMKAIGLDQDKIQQDVLGTNWMSMLDGMNAAKGRPGVSGSIAKGAGEMKKIKGYPVLIDGKYSVVSDRPQGAAEEERPKGLLGGLAKKVLKKKPSGEEAKEPTLTYHIEVLEISLVDLADTDFQVPVDYKKKG
jgi:hypothetical protein